MQISTDFSGVTEGGEGGVVLPVALASLAFVSPASGVLSLHPPPPARPYPVLTWPVNNNQMGGEGGGGMPTEQRAAFCT